jgi:hypothetical protein
MCTQPAVTPMPLPAWCTAYLHETAQGLLAADGHGERLAGLISRSLRFTRSGWSAVKARTSDARATRAALLYDQLRFEGTPSAQAYETVRKSAGLAEVLSARKLVRRGKAMLRHTPRSGRPLASAK